jgi:bidirectional [NiFe] hydrogenase diaphorase subunit
MHHLLEKINRRQGTPKDLEKLEQLCDMVKHTSLCGLGQTAPNPVLSTLRFFRHEYLELLCPDGSFHQAGATAKPPMAAP